MTERVECPSCDRRRAAHGTEGGYYHEVRHGLRPCLPCTDAHAERERERRSVRAPRRRAQGQEYRRRCVDCGVSISREATRCRSHAAVAQWQRRRELEAEAPALVLVRGVWRAA